MTASMTQRARRGPSWPIATLAMLLLPATVSIAADVVVLEEASLPIPFRLAEGQDRAGAIDVEIEASAVEPIGDGTLLLVAHDKSEGLVVAETATGRRVGEPLTCRQFPKGLPFGPKFEAMASDDRGDYYVIGSHSGKTEAERADHTQLFRFRLKGGDGGEPLAIDEATVLRWNVAKGLAKALADEGLGTKASERMKIEGLAVRITRDAAGEVSRRELVIGLREPDDLARAFAADITETPSPDAELSPRRLFAFDGGKSEGWASQISSLQYMPDWAGFLVTMSSEDDVNVFHGNTLWFLPDAAIAAEGVSVAQKVWTFEVAMKAEGLGLLPPLSGQPKGTARLVVTYDNDAKKTRIPSRLQLIRLALRPR